MTEAKTSLKIVSLKVDLDLGGYPEDLGAVLEVMGPWGLRPLRGLIRAL